MKLYQPYEKNIWIKNCFGAFAMLLEILKYLKIWFFKKTTFLKMLGYKVPRMKKGN